MHSSKYGLISIGDAFRTKNFNTLKFDVDEEWDLKWNEMKMENQTETLSATMITDDTLIGCVVVQRDGFVLLIYMILQQKNGKIYQH